jgi:anti-sigma factor RsiW
VRAAIAGLPVGQREVSLVDLAGFSYAEVAMILETDRNRDQPNQPGTRGSPGSIDVIDRKAGKCSAHEDCARMKDEFQSISETLNAYLDGELDTETITRLETHVAADSRLQRHLNELEQVRALVRAAYTPIGETASPSGRRISYWHLIGYGLAATLLVGVGIGIERWQRPAISDYNLLASLPSHAQVIQPAHLEVAAPAGEQRAIFHIVSANPQSVKSTLEHVDNAASPSQHRQSLRVEVSHSRRAGYIARRHLAGA